MYYLSYGRALTRAGHNEEAIKIDQHALALNDELPNDRYLIDILSDLAILGSRRHDWVMSGDAAERGLKLIETIGNDAKPLLARASSWRPASPASLRRGGDPADATQAKCARADQAD